MADDDGDNNGGMEMKWGEHEQCNIFCTYLQNDENHHVAG